MSRTVRRTIPLCFFAVLCCLGGFALCAQQTPENTLIVSSRLIYVDVIVRDANGRHVTGLEQSDFTITEDGHPQPISFFQSSTDAAASRNISVAALDPSAPSRPGERVFSNVASATTADPSADLILLDLLNTPVTDQLYAVKQLIKFCRKLPPGHRFALYLLTDRLYMLQGLTASSEQLSAAASRISDQDMQMTRSESDRMQMLDLINNFAKAIGNDPGGAAAHLVGEMQVEDTLNLTQRVRVTALAFAEIARSVSGYNGRKSLFWLADSFPLGLSTQLQINRSFQALDVLQTTNLIENLQIAIYPIDLGGVVTDLVGASSSGAGEVSLVGGPPTGNPSNPQAGDTMRDQFNARSAARSTMNDIAHASGGDALYGSNDIAGSIDRAVDSASAYYTLAYRPTNGKDDGHYREIAVKVDVPGCKLSFRRGYFATPPLPDNADPISTLTSAMQPETLDSSLLRLRATLFDPGKQPPAVDVTLDAGDLTYKTDANGHRHTQLLVTVLAMPHAGDVRKPTAPPQIESVLNLDLDPTQYATLLRSGLHFREQLPAAFAGSTLRLGIEEVNTGRVGTLTMARSRS